MAVNDLLSLGLNERQVGATYNGFLRLLEGRAPKVHALFVDANIREFSATRMSFL